jgi:hypothetical protein
MRSGDSSQLTSDQQATICAIWDQFYQSGKPIHDPKGNLVGNIDELRKRAIPNIQQIINQFLAGELNVHEFKTSLDGYNKRNNYWGFTAMKGQMFFNQLVKYNDDKLDYLTGLLKKLIPQPESLETALDKIAELETFTRKQYDQASNKKRVPNPRAVGYFLSYFWQIFDHGKWPVMYTSQIEAYRSIGIWDYHDWEKENFDKFFRTNEQVKAVLSSYTGEAIDNWETEHAFWYYYGNPNTVAKASEKHKVEPTKQPEPNGNAYPTSSAISAQETSLVQENVPPKFTKLIEVGKSQSEIPASKGAAFEELVGNTFDFLGFEVERLGQGKGRAPDLILKHLPEVTAFLVDTKAYKDSYSFGVDDRAIREYIEEYTPQLQKKGFKKIGFIIVSNGFKTSIDESFINTLTWETAIKRFFLLTSEALLYLTAYKVKSSLTVETVIESLVHSGNLIQGEDILSKFEDY